jgi:hypothetical protein
VIETDRNRRRVESGFIKVSVHLPALIWWWRYILLCCEQRRFERNYFFLFFFFFSNVYYKYRSKQNTRHRLSVCLNRIDEKETSPRFPAVGPYLFSTESRSSSNKLSSRDAAQLGEWEKRVHHYTHTASLIERDDWALAFEGICRNVQLNRGGECLFHFLLAIHRKSSSLSLSLCGYTMCV